MLRVRIVTNDGRILERSVSDFGLEGSFVVLQGPGPNQRTLLPANDLAEIQLGESPPASKMEILQGQIAPAVQRLAEGYQADVADAAGLIRTEIIPFAEEALTHKRGNKARSEFILDVIRGLLAYVEAVYDQTE